jgi:hypothetical protein
MALLGAGGTVFTAPAQGPSPVALTRSVPGEGGPHFYRNAAGQWMPLLQVQEGPAGVVTFTLSPEQLAGGSTVVLLGKPAWLALEDRTPPQVQRIILDGQEIAPAPEIDLGWLEVLPKRLVLEVRDAQNPLDPASVWAVVNGTLVPAGGPGLRFYRDPKNPRRGRLVGALPRLAGGLPEGPLRLTLRCDDFAPDTADCTTTFTFIVSPIPLAGWENLLTQPAATTPEGVQIFVDSIHPGYEHIECLLDGQLQTPGTTSFGSTWPSEETPVAHWLGLVFPKPRPVSGLEISWAHYQNTFWTSSRFALLTWDGKRWVQALKVQNNPEAQTTVHVFPRVTTDRVLLWVPPGGNHPQRPHLTWITEVKVRP